MIDFLYHHYILTFLLAAWTYMGFEPGITYIPFIDTPPPVSKAQWVVAILLCGPAIWAVTLVFLFCAALGKVWDLLG